MIVTCAQTAANGALRSARPGRRPPPPPAGGARTGATAPGGDGAATAPAPHRAPAARNPAPPPGRGPGRHRPWERSWKAIPEVPARERERGKQSAICDGYIWSGKEGNASVSRDPGTARCISASPPSVSISLPKGNLLSKGAGRTLLTRSGGLYGRNHVKSLCIGLAVGALRSQNQI
ncbi:putative cuticle collagen 79 [Prinia subflava]|uniref:putative cuticle collagen 79 n=1 Tax=Prinia subflava TaxID=208062 RepID=UPI002FE389CF